MLQGNAVRQLRGQWVTPRYASPSTALRVAPLVAMPSLEAIYMAYFDKIAGGRQG